MAPNVGRVRPACRTIVFGLLLSGIVIAAIGLLFSTYMMYDDEGYVLYSLRTFVAGGGLYTRVYSQYGPFFYLFHQALHALGFPFTNIGARLITFVWWVGTTGLCGAMAWRLTRSIPATAFTLGGVFLHLWVMVNEPSHPGGLISFFVAAVAWLGVVWAERPGRLALAAGIGGGALLLTKINVGIFLVASAAVWWFLHLDSERISLRLRAWLAGLAVGLLPVALMRGQFSQGWVREFALVAAAAGGATVIAAAAGARAKTRWRDALPAVIGLAGVVILTIGGVMAQHTSARSLLEGVLLGPLRHPSVFTAYVRWRPGALAWALGGFVLAAWVTLQPSRGGRRVAAFGRVLAATVFFASWAVNGSFNSHAFALSYGLAATWLFVLPLGGDEATQSSRAWLGLLGVLQALHAYPVAGSQIGWGTFLWVPLAATGTVEAVRFLMAENMLPWRRLPVIGASVVVAVTFARLGQHAWVGQTRLHHSDALGLPGAEALELPENFTTTARVLARNAAAHADMLFTLPGMLSFHEWTGVPPPTTENTTHWFTLLSTQQQDAIRARLMAAPRSCVIVQRHIYQFLIDEGIATESPLTLWLKANYQPAFSLDSYEFWVRKGRRIAALGTAHAHEAAPGVRPRYEVSVTLAEPPGTPAVSDLELGVFEGDSVRPLAVWTNTDAQLTLTPVNSAGDPAGAPHRVTLPFRPSGLCRLDVLTDRIPNGFEAAHAFLYLRDADGRRLDEARFVTEP